MNHETADIPVVLVIDDDAQTRLLVTEALEPEGFGIEEAASGDAGLEAFQRVRPDLVLLDVTMPGMSGFECCERMRRSPGGERVPIVVLTGHDDDESIARAFAVGATDFISKPMRWQLLGHRVRYLLRARNALDGLQAEIAERTKLEAQLEQAKSELLANVSHELRTPLTLILAPLEQLLRADQPAVGQRAQLERAQRNALLLLNRVNDILDFSKSEAGKFQVHWEAVDLVELVSGLAGDAAVVAEGKPCSLTWHVAPALDKVCLDRRHFEKIVLNFLSNALKFTPAGGWIRVEATCVDDAYFEFAVKDSGIGIAPDKLSLLFERFSQIDNSATRNYSGTGIGLALVKELAALMGGAVGVESEAGLGSRFFVRLPRGADRLQALPPASDAADEAGTQSFSADRAALRQLRLQDGSRPQPAPAAVPSDGKPIAARSTLPRALVVDDSPDMLDYISELLHDECDIVTAEDGEQAWALLQRMRVEIIVSDVMMPRLDGFGLTARIKACAVLSHVPVILLTARGGAGASVFGLETGADDYVVKPFSPLELKARVRAALRMSHVQADLRDKSLQAGIAQIATNVLHNVGNVLNSVNVSASLVSGKLRASMLPGLGRALGLMNEHADDLGRFLSCDEKGKLLPGYLNRLAGTLAAEQLGIIEELGRLSKSVDHIREIVTTQQSYAGTNRVVEAVLIRDLVDDALRMNAGALARHHVAVVKEFAEVPLLPLDRHRLLLILINLISNAKYAMDGVPDQAHRITLQVDMSDDHTLRIRVADTGEGIAPENMTRIFAHGFTTRKNGNGFGLHSCALAADEMGGTLTAHSDGPGKGATFALELPIHVLELAA